MAQYLPDDFKAQLDSIHNKRAKIVIQHILEHGYITTEDLKNYGYNHPPRAARDVREAGIPLETYRVNSSDGRSIAAYKFGDVSKVRQNRLEGRVTFPKHFKDLLYLSNNGKCSICLTNYEDRYLQVDHRIPYEISGDENGLDLSLFMILCGSCNRAKSWSCEHCNNWSNELDKDICSNCYWASPENYTHIAQKNERRIELIWIDKEIPIFNRIVSMAKSANATIQDFIKSHFS
jgi:hypothetical protein